MEVIETVISAFLGGTTGLLGSVVTAALGIWQSKIEIDKTRVEHAHVERLHEMNLKERSMEREHESSIAALEAERAIHIESYRHDASYGKASQWVINLLRMVRPLLTFVLLGYVGWLVFGHTNDLALRLEIQNNTIFMANMALGWWFGDRKFADRGRAVVGTPWRQS